jgi:transcriptional regulator with XRE-family HTH domain
MGIVSAIKLLIDSEKSQAKFAEKTGLKKTTVSAIYAKSDDNGVNLKTILSIVYAYKNLNVRWLLTGEGFMFIEDLSININQEVDSGEDTKDVNEEIQELKNLLKLVNARILKMERKIT